MITGKHKRADRIVRLLKNNNLFEGRMISMSKSRYRNLYPDHDVLFNARILSRRARRIVWWGDLDITADAKAIQSVCDTTRDTLHIIPELYGAFGAENRRYAKMRNNARFYFVPNSAVYYRAVSGDKAVAEKIDKMYIISLNRISWEEVKIC